MQRPLDAQVAPRDTARAPRDSTVVPVPPQPDSLLRGGARGDTTTSAVPLPARADTAKADTLKAPLARAEAPPTPDVGPEYRWDREALFASGAVTLLELLERVPGVTGLRTSWITTPQTAVYLGDPGRVRIFFDGLELAALDPRQGGVPDLAQIQIWPLEEVRIERGADELRVHLRSWRVQSTTPYSRADIFTGDEETNLFRGFFGRRYRRGGVLQVAAEQYGSDTPPQRGGAGGDALALFGRTGLARGPWSVDVTFVRTQRTRTTEYAIRSDVLDSIPSLDARRTEAYLRAGYGDPESGPWAQVIAGTLGFLDGDADPQPATAENPSPPAADSSRSRAQYLAAAGITRWGLRLSGTARAHVFEGQTLLSPAARLGFVRRHIALSVLAERSGLDSTTRTEAVVRATPVSFLALAGAGSIVRRESDGALPATAVNLRAEVGLRLGGLWLAGGLMTRDSARLAAPQVYDDTAFTPRLAPPARAVFASVRGRLWRSIYADVTGIQWDSAGLYRPRYQARSELYLQTRWLRKFPSGNFGLLASAVHEYRSATPLPAPNGDVVLTRGYRSVSTLLELRIVDAVLSWQLRNWTGEVYSRIPGYLMPRAVNLYGVRWNFWN